MAKRLLSSVVVTFLAVSLVAPMAASASESEIVIENGSFERGEAAWATWGEGDLRDEYHGVKAHEGENFLRIWSRSGWYQDFPTHKGNKYLVTAFVATARNDGLWGDAFAEVKIEWRNKAGGEDQETGQATSMKFNLTGEGEASGTIIPADEWHKIAIPVVKAPESATHCRMLVTIFTNGGEEGGGCALFDSLSVAHVGTPRTK